MLTVFVAPYSIDLEQNDNHFSGGTRLCPNHRFRIVSNDVFESVRVHYFHSSHLINSGAFDEFNQAPNDIVARTDATG